MTTCPTDSSRHTLYIAPEDVYGTAAGGNYAEVPETGCTLAPSQGHSVSNRVRDDRQIEAINRGVHTASGDINADLEFSTFDFLLQQAFMGLWEVSGAGHVLAPGTSKSSFSAIRHFSDLEDHPFLVVSGCLVNQWTLGLQVGESDAQITTGWQIIAKGGDYLAAAPTGSTLVSREISQSIDHIINDQWPGAVNEGNNHPQTLDAFSGAVKIGGEAVGVCSGIDLQLSNNVSARYAVGSDRAICPRRGMSNLTGSISLYLSDARYQRAALTKEELSLEFAMQDPAGNKYTVMIPRIVLEGGTPDTRADDDVIQQFNWQALYSQAEGTNIQLTREAV